ncbi:ABC transporter ATP-binding protein, partial [bacterium]|nr:ABC transporter ATP-binding protein [bacterium]
MYKLANKYLSTLVFFYRFLGYRVYLLLALSMGVALFDSIGLTMFIPLLGKATSGFDYTGQLGHMHVVTDFMRTLGFNFTLGGVLLVIAILFTVKGIFRYLEDFYRVRMRLIFMKSVRIKLIEGLSSLRFSAFTNANAGEIQNNMTVEVNQVILAFEHYFRAAQGIMTTLIYLTLAFITSPQFALLVVGAGLLSNLLYQRIYRYTKKLSKKVTQKGHLFHSLLLQQVHYFKYLKSTSRIGTYSKKLKLKVEEIEESQLQIGKLNSILFGSRETIATIVVILVIFIKVRFMGGLITAMLLSLMFFYRALGSVLMVQNNWNLYLGNSGSVDSVNKFLIELDLNKENSVGELEIDQVESIEIHNLVFSYCNNEAVINGLNLDIRSGETVAI